MLELKTAETEAVQTLGGILILMATFAVIFDYEIEKIMRKLCSCASSRNEDNRFSQVGISNRSSWEDRPYTPTNDVAQINNMRTMTAPSSSNVTNAPVRSHAVRRLRVVSISIS